VECASAASLSYQDLGCRRTETTHQERVGRSQSASVRPPRRLGRLEHPD